MLNSAFGTARASEDWPFDRMPKHACIPRPRPYSLSGLGAMALSACAHTAPPPRPAFDPDAAARRIALCTTTEAELRQTFGPPTRDGRLRDTRIVSWIVGESNVVRYLAVLLNARGIVVDLYWNLPTEIPWTPADQCQTR